MIPLDGQVAQAPPDAGPEPLEGLRQQLETTQQAHDILQARLVEFEAQRAVTDSAWNAVQSELERRLILQAACAAEELEREEPLARLEQCLREKDAQLLALLDERDASVASLRHAEAAAVSAQSQVAERASEVTQLQEALTDAEAAREAGHTSLSEVTAELSTLRTLSSVHHRDQATLADVRQQMARLQAEAATIEQQRRDLDEVDDRAERLRLALEHALGTHTELQQQLCDRDAANALLGQELEQARAALAERTAAAEHRATLHERQAQFEAERDRLHLEHEQLRAQNALAAVEEERNTLQQALADVSEAGRRRRGHHRAACPPGAGRGSVG